MGEEVYSLSFATFSIITVHKTFWKVRFLEVRSIFEILSNHKPFNNYLFIFVFYVRIDIFYHFYSLQVNESAIFCNSNRIQILQFDKFKKKSFWYKSCCFRGKKSFLKTFLLPSVQFSSQISAVILFIIFVCYFLRTKEQCQQIHWI